MRARSLLAARTVGPPGSTPGCVANFEEHGCLVYCVHARQALEMPTSTSEVHSMSPWEVSRGD